MTNLRFVLILLHGQNDLNYSLQVMVYVPAVPTTPDFEPTHLAYPGGQLPLATTIVVSSQSFDWSVGGTQTAERNDESSSKMFAQINAQFNAQPKVEPTPV
ncbi:MAG: hypothetical protein LBL21_01540 [Rickettsiales bacterium]|jgi:hypothetical protein|nr:hypothetical protein [Rickettsiales bacterium]